MLDLSAAFATFPVLETERLTLRAPTLDDTAALFRIRSDPEVMRYFGSPPISTREMAALHIENFQAAFQEQRGIRWVITRRGSAQMLGSCGFWRLVKEHYRAEIGYDLAPEYWGMGVMTEAVGAILGFGFGPMGLHSVEAQIDPDNSASRRVLEKLGFVQEGYFHENYYVAARAAFGDTAVFSLLGASWLARDGGPATA